ncbi:MAG: hypothetical protein OXC10_11690 [Rhodospirillaceae bacterium]|nr:hypothetical protein [Rhodospirillaceae bacterium]
MTVTTSTHSGVSVSPASHTFAARSENDWREPKEFTVTSVRLGAKAISHILISADRKYASLSGTGWDPSSRLQFYVDAPLPTPAPPMERCASHLPSDAVSVAEVEGWRDAHAHDAALVLRWNRVLAGLGEEVGAGVSPMTVTEATANQGRYMRTRWTRVTVTLEAIAACTAGAAPTVSLSASGRDAGGSAGPGRAAAGRDGRRRRLGRGAPPVGWRSGAQGRIRRRPCRFC